MSWRLSSLSIERPLLISDLLLGSGPRLCLGVEGGEEKQRDNEKLREELGSKASHVSSSMDRRYSVFLSSTEGITDFEAGEVYRGPDLEATEFWRNFQKNKRQGFMLALLR
jgi:hypothetical protein